MEVLDNLPHDKLKRQEASSPWQETLVQVSPMSSPSRVPNAHCTTSPGVAPEQLVSNAQSSFAHKPSVDVVYAEVTRPLQDELMRRCMDAADWTAAAAEHSVEEGPGPSVWSRFLDAVAGVPVPRGSPRGLRDTDAQIVFVPTGALQLFDTVHQLRPCHHLVAADFSWFPAADVLLEGCNAPIVSVTVRFMSVQCGCPGSLSGVLSGVRVASMLRRDV
jgi:hypothetical protein